MQLVSLWQALYTIVIVVFNMFSPDSEASESSVSSCASTVYGSPQYHSLRVSYSYVFNLWPGQIYIPVARHFRDFRSKQYSQIFTLQ